MFIVIMHLKCTIAYKKSREKFCNSIKDTRTKSGGFRRRIQEGEESLGVCKMELKDIDSINGKE